MYAFSSVLTWAVAGATLIQLLYAIFYRRIDDSPLFPRWVFIILACFMILSLLAHLLTRKPF